MGHSAFSVSATVASCMVRGTVSPSSYFTEAGTADTDSAAARSGSSSGPSPQDQVKAGQSAALPCSVSGFVPAGTASFPVPFSAVAG